MRRIRERQTRSSCTVIKARSGRKAKRGASKHPRLRPQGAGSRVLAAKSGLHFETLEDRTLLSTSPLTGLAGFESLAPDPDSYAVTNILVRFQPETGCATTCAGLPAHSIPQGTEVGEAFPLVPGLRKVTLGQGVTVDAALAAYRTHPLVAYAEPDYYLHMTATPDDLRYPEMWGLNNTGQTGGLFDVDIDAPEAWDITTGSGTTIVAVIDTGVDYNHPDLADNMWVNIAELNGKRNKDDDGNGYVDDIYGYDFVNGDGNPMDDQNHGTHVAGTIGAVGNNGIGVTGINWNVQIMALKFLDNRGFGSTSDAIEALQYAVANGATISNNSWGGDPFQQVLFDAIQNARNAGHLFVTAAGNGNFLGIGQDNDASPFYPASFDLDNIIAVAATDHNDNRAIFSNYGATSVDLGAPGVDILSTTRNRTYSLFSGTSMATPHVAGVAALLRDLHPGWSYTQIIDRLLETVDPVAALEGRTVTGGRLNAAAALTPDTVGPRIVASNPFGAISGSVSSVRVTFNEGIDVASFTTDDVAGLTGPAGAVAVTGVEEVAGSRGRKFDITFPTQSALGTYTMLIGPNILDRAGNAMDQDSDGVGGELVEDQYTASFTVLPFAARFDFGTSSSPVAEGYTQVLSSTGYSTSLGYGWQDGTVFGVSRSTGTDLTRDLNYARQLVFAVDVPDAIYDVTLTLGDTGPYLHDLMGVYFEGVQRDSVTTAAGQVVSLTYAAVPVTDGQLNVTLQDLGGSDVNVVLNGLTVTWVDGVGGNGASFLDTITLIPATHGNQSRIDRAITPMSGLVDSSPLANAQSAASSDVFPTGPDKRRLGVLSLALDEAINTLAAIVDEGEPRSDSNPQESNGAADTDAFVTPLDEELLTVLAIELSG